MKKLIITFITLSISICMYAQTQTWNKFEPTKDTKTDNIYQFLPSGFGWYSYKYLAYYQKLMYTNDGGTTWHEKPMPTPPNYETLQQIFFADSLNGYARYQKTYGSNNSYILMTTKDGGLTWYVQNNDATFTNFTGGNGKNLGIGLLKYVNAKFIYGYETAKDSNGNICIVPYMSNDSGKTFVNLYDNLYGGTAYFSLRDIEFVNENVGYASVGGPNNYNDIAKTTDGGNTWSIVYQTNTSVYSLEVITEDILFMNTYNLFSSTDGGKTWTDLKFTDNTFHYYAETGWGTEMGPPKIHDIFFFDKDAGLATFRSNASGSTYFLAHTKDGGKTWFQDDIDRSLFNISSTYPTNSICLVAPNKYYGMFQSYIITNSNDTTFATTTTPNSIFEISESNGIGIFPNPAKDKVYVNIVGFNPNDKYDLEVINLQGQIIFSDLIVEKTYQINLSQFDSKGLVFIKLNNESTKTSMIKKLIIH